MKQVKPNTGKKLKHTREKAKWQSIKETGEIIMVLLDDYKLRVKEADETLEKAGHSL